MSFENHMDSLEIYCEPSHRHGLAYLLFDSFVFNEALEAWDVSRISIKSRLFCGAKAAIRHRMVGPVRSRV